MTYRSTVRPRTALVALTFLLGGLLAVGTTPAAAAPVTETFGFTGADQTWVVPAGVTEIEATTCGAQGGDSAATTLEGPGPSAAGALGGCTTATVPVTPGEALTIVVGGQGAASVSATIDDSVDVEAESIPGFNGGGFGGTGIGIAFAVNDCRLAIAASAAAGGGGGGASDIRQDGSDPADRVLAGGGGGGAGSAGAHQVDTDTTICPPTVAAPAAPQVLTDEDTGVGNASGQVSVARTGAGAGAELSTFADGGNGGAGGGVTGTDGEDGTGAIGSAGTGGTDSAPGQGGTADATDGADEQGGAGGAAAAAHGFGTSTTETVITGATAGGGAGGGWFGGGGGGAGEAGELVVAGSGGAGGGSGFGPTGVSFEQGAQAGDGVVTITYDTPDAAPDTALDVVAPIVARPTFAG